jgi:hypothetical protein
VHHVCSQVKRTPKLIDFIAGRLRQRMSMDCASFMLLKPCRENITGPSVQHACLSGPCPPVEAPYTCAPSSKALITHPSTQTSRFSSSILPTPRDPPVLITPFGSLQSKPSPLLLPTPATTNTNPPDTARQFCDTTSLHVRRIFIDVKRHNHVYCFADADECFPRHGPVILPTRSRSVTVWKGQRTSIVPTLSGLVAERSAIGN